MTTFYRKYRPQKIDDLDLDSVRKSLSGLRAGKVAQAYLFVGPRGAGKTSAARILAKVVNCLNLKEGEPCLMCEMCQTIESGRAVDVMEIDAASHRGIDAIRELKDKIGLAPVAARKKVYIIDEVHMLTAEAFNALLKTLEEPPEDVMFVLCTTEAHKVPETIVSRCVRVNFTKGTIEEVLRSLRKVAEGEQLVVDEEALGELAAAVDGSFREGHKLLQELSQGGDRITLQKVQEFLGQGMGVGVEELADLILRGEVKQALVELQQADEGGVSWPIFSLKLVDYLRTQLKAQYGLGEVKIKVSPERLRLVLGRVAQACVESKTAVVEVLPLELAIVELGVTSSRRPEKEVVVPETTRVVAEEVEGKAEVDSSTSQSQIDGVEGVAGISIDEVRDKWKELIQLLEPKNHSVAGFLRSCRPKSIDDRFLVIEAFYKFHKEQLEQEARRIMVEEVVKSELSLPAVRFVLGEKATEVVAKMPEHDNLGAPSGDDKLIEAVGDVFGIDV